MIFFNSQSTNETTNIDIPKTAVASGKCGNDTQTLTLKWDSDEKDPHYITFTFVANRTSSGMLGASNNEIARGKYGLKIVEGVIQKDANLFPNATDPGMDLKLIKNLDSLSICIVFQCVCVTRKYLVFSDTPVTLELNGHGSIQTIFKHSYLCNSVESIKDDNATVTLKLAKLHLDAFRDPTSPKDFSAGMLCSCNNTVTLWIGINWQNNWKFLYFCLFLQPTCALLMTPEILFLSQWEPLWLVW